MLKFLIVEWRLQEQQFESHFKKTSAVQLDQDNGQSDSASNQLQVVFPEAFNERVIMYWTKFVLSKLRETVQRKRTIMSNVDSNRLTKKKKWMTTCLH
jgi:hypothetical protein